MITTDEALERLGRSEADGQLSASASARIRRWLTEAPFAKYRNRLIDDIEKGRWHALDDAFENQVEHLFSNWMKDSTHQPARAAAGVRKAVAAYRHAITAIDTQHLVLEMVPLPRPREVRR